MSTISESKENFTVGTRYPVLDKDPAKIVMGYYSPIARPKGALSEKVESLFEKIFCAWALQMPPSIFFDRGLENSVELKIAKAAEFVRRGNFESALKLLEDPCFNQSVVDLEEHPRYLFLEKCIQLLEYEFEKGKDTDKIRSCFSKILEMVVDREFLRELPTYTIHRRRNGIIQGHQRAHLNANRKAQDRKIAIQSLLTDAAELCCKMDLLSGREIRNGQADGVVGLEALFDFDEKFFWSHSMHLWKIAMAAKSENCESYLSGWMTSERD